MASIQLNQINIYPVKSIEGISVSQSWVEKQGLTFDRRLMLAFADGGMVTARQFPQMVKISSVLTPEGLIFNASGQGQPLHLKYQDFKRQAVTTTVWKDTFTAYTTTDEANDWFSSIIGRQVELLYTGQISNRYREKVGNEVSFADGAPVLVIGQASLDELNRRSPEHHQMAEFRPNLVVSGHEAFAEDGWQRIRIGEVEFESLKPCQRCILTTVDVESGQFRTTKEPLQTLSQFRANASGNVFFGQNWVARNEGVIRVGDSVEILQYQTKPVYPDRQPQAQMMTCVDREEIARDFVTFWLAPESGPFPSYLPGQHLPVAIDIDGEKVSRRYTLSSSPSRPGRLSISVKRVDQGKVSNWLLEHFQIGDTLSAQSPDGQFFLQQDSRHPLLLLSAGSGVTPMLSMLRYLSDCDQIDDVVFYHQCRTEADIPCRDELERLSNLHSGLKIRISLTQAPVDWFGLKGRFSLSHMRQIESVVQRQVFVCGPDGFMKKAKNLLLKAGLPEAAYHQEAFGVSLAEDQTYRELNLTINGQTFVGNNRRPLLEQAEDQGLSISNSCRAGLCGACLVKVEQGRVFQPDVPAMDQASIDQGMALACCCVPKTDVDITY
jgi:uncharacterized protein YcbX/ferredoxin-NADP reductase